MDQVKQKNVTPRTTGPTKKGTMHIEVDQKTYNRLLKYSAHVGISANLVVKEAIHEYIDQWDDAVDVVLTAKEKAPKKAPASRTKRKTSPPSLPANVRCIDTSKQFTSNTMVTPNVGLVDLLSVQ